jgi:hypothetical protein
VNRRLPWPLVVVFILVMLWAAAVALWPELGR